MNDENEPSREQVERFRRLLLDGDADAVSRPAPYTVGLTHPCVRCEQTMIDDVLEEGEVFNENWKCTDCVRIEEREELTELRKMRDSLREWVRTNEPWANAHEHGPQCENRCPVDTHNSIKKMVMP